MILRIVIYGTLIVVLGLLATDPTIMIIGGPTSLSGPGGGLSLTDPSPVFLVPIALLVWVALRQWKQRAAKSENDK